MPQLYRLDIMVTEEEFPLAEALVAEYAESGWEEESLPTGDMLLRVTCEQEEERDALAAQLAEMLPAAQLTRELIPDQDWLANWRSYFTPVEAGEFLILPPWMRDEDPHGCIPIVIEPKSAFGTGHHPTTTMCLEAISRLHKAGALKAGQTFLDMGTGTGILGIGCVKLGLSGFGADIGYEKFWNLKCHYSGLTPDAAVIVATVRALKSHGGAPTPVPGRPLPEEYSTENVGYVEAGCCNLLRHIENVKKSGVSPVVCINSFVTDTPAEIAKIRELCEAAGARVATSTHWEHGGAGALELADAVMDACEEKTEFKPLYDWSMPFKERIELVAREVYGADGVDFSAEAESKLAAIQKRDDANELGLCMAKTQYSFSDNPDLKGAPTGWRLKIRDVLIYGGAGFVVPVSGKISLMPGTGANPAFRRVDVDVETGKVSGVF